MTFGKSVKHQNLKSTQHHKPLINKIGLMGPFGGGNLGDAAIQQSAIANFRRLNPDLDIWGFSIKPLDTQARHNIPTYPLNKTANALNYAWWRGDERSLTSGLTTWLNYKRKNPHRHLLAKIIQKFVAIGLETTAWWRAYRHFKQQKFDLLIVSGGGQLDDYWGGAWNHPFTLLCWGIIAKLSGSKFLLVSVGAAPINQLLSKLFTRITLSLADYRSYRDAESKAYIESIVGFQHDDPVYTDLAFSLPTESYSSLPTSQSIIGIGVMSYCHPQFWPQKDPQVYTNYLHKLADFGLWLVQQGHTLAIFPGQVEHDAMAIADFQELLQQRNVPQSQILLPSIATVDELIQQLLATKIVVASRFHGVLLSLLVHKPVLALSYHPKIETLMANTGQSQSCFDIEEFELETIKNQFRAIANRQEEIVEQLAAKTQLYKSALTQQYEYLFSQFRS